MEEQQELRGGQASHDLGLVYGGPQVRVLIDGNRTHRIRVLGSFTLGASERLLFMMMMMFIREKGGCL